MANGTGMDHGTDLQQQSPTSPTLKCEALHHKYFETVAYSTSGDSNPGRADTSQDVTHTNQEHPPPTSSTALPKPNCINIPTLPDSSSHKNNNKPSVPQTSKQTSGSKQSLGSKQYLASKQSLDSVKAASTSVKDSNKGPPSIPPRPNLPRPVPPRTRAAGNTGITSSSKPPSQRKSKRPLETSFPVEPVIVETRKAAGKVSAVSAVSTPQAERLKKKGIKTSPLIKTSLRTSTCKPKSPLVTRVTRPAIAIKTTVSVDTKAVSGCVDTKSKGVDTKHKGVDTKQKGAVVDNKPSTSDIVTKSTVLKVDVKGTGVSVTKGLTVETKSDSCVSSKVVNDKVDSESSGIDIKPNSPGAQPTVVSLNLDSSSDVNANSTGPICIVNKPNSTSDQDQHKDQLLSELVDVVKQSDLKSESFIPDITKQDTTQAEVVEEGILVCKDLSLSVISEESAGSDLKDYIGIGYGKDNSNLDESDSVRVNVDTDSVNTVTDPIDEDFCTQYSGADSEENFCDSKETADSDSKDLGDTSLISNDSECKTDSALDIDDESVDISEEFGSDKTTDIGNIDGIDLKDLKSESKEARINRIKVKSSSLTRKSHDDPGYPFDQARPSLKESGSRLSILRNWNDNLKSLYHRNRSFDSGNSSFESFYSIDNGNVETSLGSKSRKLKWTPRILSETQFSSVNSGTFSDCASFYTADTCGTFYSAREFQLDSCDNFQTCDDFQKFDLTPRSKFSKAKEALQRGKNFVKAKFDDYKKRLPTLRRSDQVDENAHHNNRFKSLCHHSCGFSCVHLGKEISQYSLPDYGAAKGDNPGENPGEATTGESGCDKGGNQDKGGDQDKGDNDDVGTSPESEEKQMMADMDTAGGVGSNCGEEPKISNGSPTSSSAGEQISNPAERQISQDDNRTVKMERLVRGTTEADEDDMPVGTEAISIPRSHRPSESRDTDERPASKRLRWVSALEKTQGTSLTSSFTSNSSVDQLLHQREMDPETLLNNLGFGQDPHTDDSLSRIPERFVVNPCSARGINLQQFLVNHPELHHLLPMLSHSQTGTPLDSVSCGGGSSQLSGSENQSTASAAAGACKVPLLKKGSMQRQHTFSGVLHGMRFIREVQTASPPVPDEQDQKISQLYSVLDFLNQKAHALSITVKFSSRNLDEEDQKISQLHSVLDFPNRKALARQGFYGPDILSNPEEVSELTSEIASRSMTAQQKRKQFFQSCKSRSKNWSLTEESENDKGENVGMPSRSVDSWDKGLMLRSFSERFSSDSSLESTDSYEDSRKRLIKQNSISHLRKQYQDTIRQSMDGEFPVFEDMNNNETEDGQKLSISEVRKKQVDRLMASKEDDGDYLPHTRQSTLKDNKVTILQRAQNSTQSTISSSPHSPNDLKFSFESGLNDGESEFGFNSQPNSPPKKQTSDVSVIVKEEARPKFELHPEESAPGEATPAVSNPNELELPSLVFRSDSCNTLVSQDTGDHEHLEGELTPRPGDSTPGVTSPDGLFINKLISGDALSESSASTRTLTTGQDNLDRSVPASQSDEEEERSQSGEDQRSPDRLRPVQNPFPPQESFELEEISSAEDMNGNNIPKSQTKRGPLEKSASTHSDSSGFADLDTVGETIQTSLTDMPKDIFTSSSAKPRLTKQRTLPQENQLNQRSPSNHHHDNTESYHDNTESNHGNTTTERNHDNTTDDDTTTSRRQTEALERRILVEKQACLLDQMMSPAIEETKALYVCSKEMASSRDNVSKPYDSISDKETANPELESISLRSDSDTDKSIVYTVNVPLVETTAEVCRKQLTVPKRFVSKVSMKVLTAKDSGDSQSTISDRSDGSRIVQISAVQHEEIGTSAEKGTSAELSDKSVTCIEPDNPAAETSIFAEIQKSDSEAVQCETFQQSLGIVSPTQSDIPKPSLSVKSDIRSKQKAKEALVAAANQTADWLLSNEKQRLNSSTASISGQNPAHYNLGRPVWASTPDLKQQPPAGNIRQQARNKALRLVDTTYSHSLDIHPDEDRESFLQRGELFRGDHSRNHVRGDHSHNHDGSNFRGGNPARSNRTSRPPIPHHHSADYSGWNNHVPGSTDDLRAVSQMSSEDESVGGPRFYSSAVESSVGMPEDHMHYLKLARLVNGPSLVMNYNTKMPIARYTPNLRMKNWVDAPQKILLEEETQLMQHAVQRYKVELSVMETMLTTMVGQAKADLDHDERAEVEELQQLWAEVRREVDKMERLLTDRVTALRVGNDRYSPLDALQIIQAMIDLLREQLYHQQMCITKDFRLHTDDLDDRISVASSNLTSTRSLSEDNSALLSDLSQQVSEVKVTVARSQELQKQALQETFSELKSSLLSEVKGELSTTTSSNMLQLQLQARDNEIQRLRMELLLQSVDSGKTRKKVMLESDV